MIYVNNAWLSAAEGLVQLTNETRGSHKLYLVRCDSQKHEKCRKEYKMPYKDYLRYLSKNNNEKTYCLQCSRREKHSGRLNPNTKYTNIDDSFFSIIDSNDKAYLLGWIASDGTISKNGCGFNIVIHSKDMETLKSLRDIICKETKIYPKKGKNTSLYGFTINSQSISKDLCTLLNIKPGKKSSTINFPNIDEKYYYEFIRGYFDGDGTINSVNNKRKLPQSMITSNSKLFLSKLKEIMGLGFITGSNLEMSKNDTFTFCERIYESNGLRLERKHSRYLEWMQYYNQKKIEKQNGNKNNAKTLEVL